MKEVTTIKGAKRFFRRLKRMNTRAYNLSKACEELTELEEIILKKMNKRPINQPAKQLFIEEIGDVEMRLFILKDQLNITTKELNDRKISKANKFIGYINKGEYTKNI